jgi:hypothetical protein
MKLVWKKYINIQWNPNRTTWVTYDETGYRYEIYREKGDFHYNVVLKGVILYEKAAYTLWGAKRQAKMLRQYC